MHSQALANARAAMQRRQEQLQGRADQMGIDWDTDDGYALSTAAANPCSIEVSLSENSSVDSAHRTEAIPLSESASANDVRRGRWSRDSVADRGGGGGGRPALSAGALKVVAAARRGSATPSPRRPARSPSPSVWRGAPAPDDGYFRATGCEIVARAPLEGAVSLLLSAPGDWSAEKLAAASGLPAPGEAAWIGSHAERFAMK